MQYGRHPGHRQIARFLGLVMCVVALLALGPDVASAKKPPKPPPEPSGPAYKLIDLGDLGGGRSKAYAINEAGQVVGFAFAADDIPYPFVVTPEDTDDNGTPDLWFRDDDDDGVNDLMIRLDLLGGGELPNSVPWYGGSARDINDEGQVIGFSSIDDPTQDESDHAFLWEDLDGDGQPDAGEMIDLGTLDAGKGSIAMAINNHGQVVGFTATSSTYYGSFLVSPEDTDDDGTPDSWFKDADGDGANDLMVGLGDTFGARDINDAGEVAGKERVSPGRGFLLVPEDTNSDGTPDLWWSDDDGDGLNDLLDELEPLGTGQVSAVNGLNASGQVTGASMTGGKKSILHAVRWASDLTPTDLGAPGRRDTSKGLALNDGGDVVGEGGGMGILWADGELYKLLDLLTNSDGIDKIIPRDINNSGYIVGETNRDGQLEAYIAVPTGD